MKQNKVRIGLGTALFTFNLMLSVVCGVQVANAQQADVYTWTYHVGGVPARNGQAGTGGAREMTEDEIRAFCVKPTPCQYETGEDPATRCPIFAFKEDAEECKDSLCCENGWRCDPNAAEASCVQCLGDSDCVRYGKQKRCDVNEHACVECLGNSDCADNAYCTGDHVCFQCE